ncbi:hypothetical protein SARC_08359 [Sphaeroforma arctica JP610]|uniref:Aquaporin n=1 Tax=Sphaeroforma arctica JP610 TaxID=667725 RepID=A0A0L0FRC0_9EUKA|nr:hypothetical protein SARC_08359 [Sphaeroforma arctica JP610]KNC79234.1 hypothetical protein SARC_08359 [Sphaeroforma arctica JP610]|eukprot:XP_014153136.1 hypothetical protein SARC_08359 [Sphaeroforma arctica JP610]
MYSSAGSNIGSTPFEVASNRQRSSNLNFFDSDTRANTEVHSQMDFHDTSSDSPVGREQSDRQDNPQSNIQPMASQASDMSPYVIPENLLVYERLLIQDQNAKLSVFATRPAIYHWQTNLLSEIMAAFALIWFALMIEENGYLMPNEDGMTAFVNQTSPFMVGALVTGCVLGYVGPTGFAANAARDLAPRFFHFIAPIPNKGPSEWHYAWVPILGPYIGGTIAGLCFVGTRNLLTYPAWSSAIVSQQTMFGGLTDVF